MSSQNTKKSCCMEMGTRIREARKSAGLTQQEAADLGKVSVQSWCEYEAGRSTPKMNAMGFFHQKGISLGWIATGEGPKRLGEEGTNEGKASVTNMMSSYLEGAVISLRKIEQKDSASFISCLHKINTELQKVEEREKEPAKKSVANGTTG
jgi:transcriptional regulator with XRE-family HTH domain